MSYQISASTSMVSMFEDYPDARTQAIIPATIAASTELRKSTIASVISKAINGINWRMESFWKHGDNVSWGRPYSVIEAEVMDMSTVYFELDASYGQGNWYLELDFFGLPTDEMLINRYLLRQHDHNRYDNSVSTLPATGQTILDAFETSVKNDAEADIQTQVAALYPNVPVNRTTEVEATYQGETVTLVEEFTVTSEERVNPVFTVDTQTTKYVDASFELDTDFIKTWILNFQGKREITAYGQGFLTYQETRRRYYRLADNSIAEETNYLYDPVELTTGPLSYVDQVTYDYTDTTQFSILPRANYYYVEYHTLDDDGKKIPGIRFGRHFTWDDLGVVEDGPAFEIDGLEYDRRVQEVTGHRHQYYPIIPIIKSHVNIFRSGNEADPYYTEGVQLGNKLDIDIVHIADKIQENPDIGDVDEAYLMLATDITSERQAAIGYLTEFFAWAHSAAEANERIPVGLNNEFRRREVGNVGFGIRVTGGDVELQLRHNGIGSRFVQGRIGSINYCERVFNNRLTRLPGDTQNLLHSEIIFRKQVTDSVFQEIVIVNLEHTNVVYGDGYVVTTLDEVFISGESDKSLFIPLRRDLVDNLDSFTQQDLHYESVQLVFHAYEKRKLKWYESGVFKALLIIIAVVVLIYTGIDLYSAVTAAYTAGGISAAMVVLTEFVIGQFILALALEYAVKLVGPEIAFVAAIAAFVAGSISSFGKNIGNMEPTDWLKLSNSISEATNTKLQEDMLEFEKELKEFTKTSTELQEELEALQKELEPSDDLNPFLFLQQQPVSARLETPSAFYQRTLTTNVASMTYDAIEHYVDFNLDLSLT